VRGTTEAINLVAKSWGSKHIGEGDEIVISHLEHHANIVPWQMLCAETGAKLRVAPVDDDGQVLLNEYERLLNSRTKLVSFTQVSNALGTVTPARQMIEMAHRAGARVLLDGAQSVSHLRADVQYLDCDFFVFSGHKVFGPTGIGALYGKPEVLADMPAWQGGGNMIADVTFEKTRYHEAPAKFEAGTGNIADAVGLGAAIDYVQKLGIDNINRYEHELLVYAMRELKTIPRSASDRHRAGQDQRAVIRAGGLPDHRSGRGIEPRRHRRAHRPPLRPAHPAPLRSRSDCAPVTGVLQHARRDRPLGGVVRQLAR